MQWRHALALMDLRKTAEGDANKINVHVSKSYDGKMRL